MSSYPGSVLACIDGSRFSAAVCDYAAWVSQQTGAPLTLLHNIEHSSNAAQIDLSGAIGFGSREALLEELTDIEARRGRLMLEQGKQMLERAHQRVQQFGVEATLKQRHDGLTESLIAMENEIRVLVLGVRGEEHAQDDDHLGTHLESSIRALHRPILVVNSDFTVPKRVMLAYDGSDASEKALALSVNSPLFKGLPIHLVSVDDSPSRSASLQASASERLRSGGHEVIAANLNGSASDALHDYQEEHDIDLTLMGAFSHTRLREFVLGSLTAKMLLSAQRPLLLLR